MLVRDEALLRPGVGGFIAPMCVPEVVLEAPHLVRRRVPRGVTAPPAMAVHRSATGTPSVRLPEVDGVRRWTMRLSRPPVFR